VNVGWAFSDYVVPRDLHDVANWTSHSGTRYVSIALAFSRAGCLFGRLVG